MSTNLLHVSPTPLKSKIRERLYIRFDARKPAWLYTHTHTHTHNNSLLSFNYLLKQGFFKTISRILLFTILLSNDIVFAQYALVLNNSPYIVLNGGTSGKPIHLVINSTGANANGIYVPAGAGKIISESEFNYVNWVISSGTGTYTVPFYDKTNTTQIPFAMNIGHAGVAGASNHILFSTYQSSATLTTYATYNGAASIPNMNLEYTSPGVDNSANVVERWWIVDAASYEGGSYTTFTNRPYNVTLYFDFNAAAEIHGQTLTNLDVQPYAYNATENKWDPTIAFAQASSTAGIPDQVVSPSIPLADFFRAWVLVNKNALLPIELLSFNANCDNAKVDISWSTASETNNNYFTIERSNDGLAWVTLGTVPGAGNSNTAIIYPPYTDNNPYPGTSYYRLKQTDYNGQSETFNAIAVNCSEANPENTGISLIYPNPANDNVYVTINSAESGNGRLSVYNTIGQKIIERQVTLAKGENVFTINISGFAEGIYPIAFINEQGVSSTRKIIKSK